jgi:hypothetical protein
VHQLKINYAMKDKNPVDSVSFYNGNDGPFHLPKSKVSLMIPDVFEEKCARQSALCCAARCVLCRALCAVPRVVLFSPRPEFLFRYLRLYVKHEAQAEAARRAWDNFLIREHFIDSSAEFSQSQLLKASPARTLKTGRPPVAPPLSGTRLELFPVKEEAAKKKTKLDLVAKSGDKKLTDFFSK